MGVFHHDVVVAAGHVVLKLLDDVLLDEVGLDLADPVRARAQEEEVAAARAGVGQG